MKQSYPNSTECSMAILKEYYGWNYSVEYRNPMNYIENFLKQYNKYFRYKISDDGFVINHDFNDDTGNWSADVEYRYNPNNDFNSFASSASTHDGTLMFVYDNITDCVHDLIYLLTREFGEKINSPIAQGDKTEVIFGDMAFANANKPEFGTKEKPWRTQRTIIVIPTKINIVRAKEQCRYE